LTNDSEWGARIAAPATRLEKTYHAQIAVAADGEFVNSLPSGVRAKDGELLRAKHARLLRAGQKNCWLEIVLDEGKNRHIRRMMEALGVEVLRLIRVAIGPLQLDNLAKGEHRALTAGEKQTLDRAVRRKTL
jgi:23S rRNA pseudouridine2605 synthase